ncbi:MAG: Bifunctional protein GlmU [Phycisphaerae bacterium]|nr:Bifunctional protein GlmU [Phycisphaerae bacterium]
MKSDLPKVVHEICGRPMLAYVLEACRQAGVSDCFLIVGHQKQRVIDCFAGQNGLHWVEQAEQHGTGHAVMCARESIRGRYEHVLVLCGDGPLIRGETVKALLSRHLETGSAATLATSTIDDPTGYGRIVRDADGAFAAIVEHNDCTAAQREIHEVNPSYYCFRTADLLTALDQIRPDNAKREYYLTDVFSILVQSGRRVAAVSAVPPQDVLSINSRRDLALVNGIMQGRIQERLMNAGVTIVDPGSTWIDSRAEIGADTAIHPFVVIRGAARIGGGAAIGPFAHLDETAWIPDGASVSPGTGMCG